MYVLLAFNLVAFLDPLGGIDGIVRQRQVGSGALDGDQGFQDRVAFVKVTRRGGLP